MISTRPERYEESTTQHELDDDVGPHEQPDWRERSGGFTERDDLRVMVLAARQGRTFGSRTEGAPPAGDRLPGRSTAQLGVGPHHRSQCRRGKGQCPPTVRQNARPSFANPSAEACERSPRRITASFLATGEIN